MFVPYVLIVLQKDNTTLLLQKDNVSFGKGSYSRIIRDFILLSPLNP